MAASESNTRHRSMARFSIGAMLVVITCFCCFLAGDRYGYQRGLNRWNAMPVYVTAYVLPDIESFDVKYADELAEKIRSEVVPTAWQEAGGNCHCAMATPVDGTKPNLIVNANAYVHQQLQSHIADARNEYNPQEARKAADIDYPSTNAAPILGGDK